MTLTTEEVDKKDITASDYTVHVTGLPKNATSLELSEYFSQFGELYKSSKTTENENDNEASNMYDNDFDTTGTVKIKKLFELSKFLLHFLNKTLHINITYLHIDTY